MKAIKLRNEVAEARPQNMEGWTELTDLQGPETGLPFSEAGFFKPAYPSNDTLSTDVQTQSPVICSVTVTPLLPYSIKLRNEVAEARPQNTEGCTELTDLQGPETNLQFSKTGFLKPAYPSNDTLLTDVQTQSPVIRSVTVTPLLPYSMKAIKPRNEVPEARPQNTEVCTELTGIQWPETGLPFSEAGFFKPTYPSNDTLLIDAQMQSPFMRSVTAIPALPHPMSILNKLKVNQPTKNIDMEAIRQGSPELTSSYQTTFFLNDKNKNEKPDSSDIKRLLFTSTFQLSNQLVQLLMDLIHDHTQHSAFRIKEESVYYKTVELNTSDFKAYLSDLIDFLINTLTDDDSIEAMSVMMIIYLDIYLKQKRDYLHFNNLSNLIIASAMLAHKFIEDGAMLNQNFAEELEMPINELNKLEFNFIQDVDYKLNVLPQTFSEYRTGLFNYCTLKPSTLSLNESISRFSA